MRSSARIAALCLSLLLAGCATVSLVDPAKPAAVGDGITVMPQVKWNQLSSSKQIVWTQNGFTLDAVRFADGVKSGAPLHPVAGLRKDTLGTFDSKMLPNDIQDLEVSTLEKEGMTEVRATNLAPCPFGSAPGFCFDLAFATRDGLAMKGKVIASKRADRLDLIEFRAPVEYYYETVSPSVAAVFASINVK
jgi:hypothetical protein